jgi:hypothetical protein
MFEVDSADMCTGKCLLTFMGGWVEGVAFADPGANGNFKAKEEHIYGGHLI